MAHARMNSEMATGFTAGSGVDPQLIKVMVMTIASGVILLVFAWFVLQLMVAYKDERLKAAEAFWGALKATVILIVLFTFLALL